jgi:hypothetical protein
MLLRSLGELYLAPGGHRSIWKYLEGLVWSTRVTGRFACGFRSDLHFADDCMYYCEEWQDGIPLLRKTYHDGDVELAPDM